MLVPLWVFALEMDASPVGAAAPTPGSAMSALGAPRWESRWREPVGGIRWIMNPLLSLVSLLG